MKPRTFTLTLTDEDSVLLDTVDITEDDWREAMRSPALAHWWLTRLTPGEA
jgi:hypothetical protein